jgi:hypothetical protein
MKRCRTNFKNTSLALVQHKAAIIRLSNVRIVPGQFRESFAAVERCRFSFVHIDCDVYDSYRECLDFFYSRMSPNGVLLFDEYMTRNGQERIGRSMSFVASTALRCRACKRQL